MIILIVISILNSGCTEKYENPGNAPQNLETAVPTKTQNPVSPKTQDPIPATEKIQLENYDGGIFSMKKPAGWEVITAGSCATLGILARDRNAPENQVFIFLEFGPVYLSEQKKRDDIDYMKNGGYPVIYIEMPVVDPFTPDNFLKQFNFAARTNAIRNYMNQIPVLDNVEIISSNKVNNFMGGDSNVMRALFKQNGKLSEGLFYVIV